MAQDWYTAQTGMPPAPTVPATFELRPLSLGELLDRTFGVYRARFWLFAGISAVYAAIALVLNLLNLVAKHMITVRHGLQTGTYAALGGTYIALLLLLVPAAITQAATVFAVSEVYLGKDTSATIAMRATIGRWYRYIGIAVWLSWSFGWLPALLWVPGFVIVLALKSSGLAWLGGILIFLGFCAVPYGIWALLRNMLAIQACVIEGATVRTAMRRSKLLTMGAKWRVVVVVLISVALLSAASALQMPLVLLVMKSPLQEHNLAQALSLLVNSLAQAVITPVGLIGLSLVYFDQRVRQEGFDLLVMLGPGASAPAAVSGDAMGDHAAS